MRFLLSCLLIIIPTQIMAKEYTPSPKFDGLFYYKIGGAKPITIPPSPILTTINLSFSAGLTGVSCDNFDPQVSIENFFDNLKDGADDAMIALQNAASAAIASLPGYIIAKANPTQYDIFQNGLLRGWGKFTLATKSCEQMMSEIRNGVDPYEKWISASVGDDWKATAGMGGADVVRSRKTIAENAGNSGVKTFGGRTCGTSNTPSCKPVRNTVLAGWNLSLGRLPTDTSIPAQNNQTPLLAQRFRTPTQVQDWVYQVLGDKDISTCQGCPKGSKPGRGLLPFIDARSAVIRAQLRTIIQGVNRPTRDNLQDISAPGIAISVHLIEAIRSFPDPYERGMVADKLAAEIGLAQVLEEAIIIRRLLLTGQKEANADKLGMLQKEINSSLQELEKEIDSVHFEIKARKAIVSNTVIQILEKSKAENEISRLRAIEFDDKQRDFSNGKVNN